MKASLFFVLTVLAAAAQAQAPAPAAPAAAPMTGAAATQPIRPMPAQPSIGQPAGSTPAPLGSMASRPASGMNGGQPMPPAYTGASNAQPMGTSAATPPGRFVPRNPLRPAARPTPVVAHTNPAMGNVPPGLPFQNRPAGMNGFPVGTVQQPIPGIPMPGAVEEQDPVKATGKRIGKLNGQDIFKLENAYFFDKPTPKKKQK